MTDRRVAPDHTGRALGELVRLHDRVAVVTGAARGLGAQIVERFAEAGADVVAGDVDVAGVEATAAAVAARWGRRVLPVRLDVADPDSIVAAADLAVAELGHLDIWVNNAGISSATGPAVDVSVAFLDRMLEVNTRGTYLGAREAARRMAGNEAGGVVVNIISTTGFRGTAGISAYSMSKHAVVGITKSLGVEFGPLGIRVLGVAPGIVDTPGVRLETKALADAGVDIAARMGDNPLGRMGVPDDIARIVLFAASDLAAFMTGSTLFGDAGRLAN